MAVNSSSEMRDPRQRFFVRLRLKYRGKYDAVSMALYALVVYGWGLTLYPLGKDFALLEEPGQGMSVLAGVIFKAEVALFGASSIGYHAVNLAIMYVCMVCLYFLVNSAVPGPFWLGTLAATLFMANPACGEAVLSLSGVADLAPCLFALAALTLYARNVLRFRRWQYIFALVLFALASLGSAVNVFLFVVVALYEGLVVPRGRRRLWRLAPFVVIGLGSLGLYARSVIGQGWNLAGRFAPLYFLFYPVGFLPETARRFHESPWLGWVSALAVLVLVVLVVRKVQMPPTSPTGSKGAESIPPNCAAPLLVGLLGMAAIRASGGDRPIDLVHLVGGGQLLPASALYHLALVALFYRMMQHPKWRLTIIGATTLLCVVYFAMQIHQDFRWRRAAREVRAFQAEAARLASVHPGKPIAVCPDYREYRGAPMGFSEALGHTTPFSNAIPAVSVLPLRFSEGMEVVLDAWTPEGGAVVVRGVMPLDVVWFPYTLSRPGLPWQTETATVILVEVGDKEFRLSVRARENELPVLVLPAKTAIAPSTREFAQQLDPEGHRQTQGTEE